jgi:Ca2+-binding RTX toxin-like protein
LKLYQVTLTGATDISDLNSVSSAPAGSITPVQKTLVANLYNFPGFTTDNFEGMTFGPTLPNGTRTLVFVSDNNFGQYELFGNYTRIAAFEFHTESSQSSVTATLPATENNLTLTGTDNINGTGNENNNIIAGNDADNVLFGKPGSDIILGNGGNDTLAGGLGDDTLTGGAGADKFVRKYSTTGTDTIADFQPGEDFYYVSASGFGGGLIRGAVITPEQFTIGSGAVDSNTRFIYNNDTGALFFDADGTGATAQVQTATLSTGLAMSNSDIFVFA